MWKTTVQLARERGVSRQTTFRWVQQGKYARVERTEGGHFRVWCEPDRAAVICYCRVSSAKQSSSLDTQERLLRTKYPEAEIIRDIGSGFNFNRKGLQAVLERCLQGTTVTLVATTHDRICRTAFPLVRWIVELHGGTIECLEEVVPSEGFDSSTLLAFLTSFCASHHGRRSGRRKQKDSDLSDE